MSILMRGLITLGFCVCLMGAAAANEADYQFDGTMVIDPESGHVALNWTVTLDEDQPERLTFLLRKTLGNIEVTGTDVASFELETAEFFSGEAWRLVVTTRPQRPGQERKFHMTYGGVLMAEPVPSDLNSLSEEKIELTLDSLWMPLDTRFTQLVTANVDIEIPGTWTGIGAEIVQPTEKGVRVTNVIPALDVPIMLLKSYRLTQDARYAIYDTRADDTGIDALKEATAYCTNYLDRHFGQSDPLPRAKMVVHERQEGGYARRTLISLSNIKRLKPQGLTIFICHELGHYWSSGGNANSVENWLNESFAEYVAVMALREKFGEAAFEEQLAVFRAQVERAGETPPVWVPGARKRGPHIALYRKGPLALAALEAKIGRAVFEEFVRSYMTQRIATTPDLLDALERIAGREARSFLTERLAE